MLGDINEWLPLGRPLRWMNALFGRSPAERSFPSRWPLVALDRVWVRPRHALLALKAHRTPLAAARFRSPSGEGDHRPSRRAEARAAAASSRSRELRLGPGLRRRQLRQPVELRPCVSLPSLLRSTRCEARHDVAVARRLGERQPAVAVEVERRRRNSRPAILVRQGRAGAAGGRLHHLGSAHARVFPAVAAMTTMSATDSDRTMPARTPSRVRGGWHARAHRRMRARAYIWLHNPTDAARRRRTRLAA